MAYINYEHMNKKPSRHKASNMGSTEKYTKTSMQTHNSSYIYNISQKHMAIC